MSENHLAPGIFLLGAPNILHKSVLLSEHTILKDPRAAL